MIIHKFNCLFIYQKTVFASLQTLRVSYKESIYLSEFAWQFLVKRLVPHTLPFHLICGLALGKHKPLFPPLAFQASAHLSPVWRLLQQVVGLVQKHSLKSTWRQTSPLQTLFPLQERKAQGYFFRIERGFIVVTPKYQMLLIFIHPKYFKQKTAKTWKMSTFFTEAIFYYINFGLTLFFYNWHKDYMISDYNNLWVSDPSHGQQT